MTQSTRSASVGLIPKMDSGHVSKSTEGNCSKELSKCVNKNLRQDEDHCGWEHDTVYINRNCLFDYSEFNFKLFRDF